MHDVMWFIRFNSTLFCWFRGVFVSAGHFKIIICVNLRNCVALLAWLYQTLHSFTLCKLGKLCGCPRLFVYSLCANLRNCVALLAGLSQTLRFFLYTVTNVTLLYSS